MKRVVFVTVLLSFASAAFAGVKIDRLAYHGWAHCYRMSNGTVELIYVPQIGRIMRYARVGGPNILWENSRLAGKTQSSAKAGEWTNYGGDKLWPAPQSLWNWPPDPVLDGAPYGVAIVGDSLAITGAISEKSHLRFTRRISMDQARSTVRIENWMTNTGAASQALALWEITQTDNPDRVIVPLQPTPKDPAGWSTYEDKPVRPGDVKVTGENLIVHRSSNAGFKLGSASDKGILVAEKGIDRFSMSVKKAPGTYPDGGKFLEVFGSGDPDKYMELEITGPISHLLPGRTIALNMIWRLDRVASAAN